LLFIDNVREFIFGQKFFYLPTPKQGYFYSHAIILCKISEILMNSIFRGVDGGEAKDT
jgi:hypothetical protein